MRQIIMASSPKEATDKIFQEYSIAYVSMDELLRGIEIQGLSVEGVVETYANCMAFADNDVLLRANIEENTIRIAPMGAVLNVGVPEELIEAIV